MTRNPVTFDTHGLISSGSTTGMDTTDKEEQHHSKATNNHHSSPLEQSHQVLESFNTISMQQPQSGKEVVLVKELPQSVFEILQQEHASSYGTNESERLEMAEKARSNPAHAPLTAENLIINAAEHSETVSYTPIADRNIKDQMQRTQLAWEDPKMREKMVKNFTSHEPCSPNETLDDDKSQSLDEVFRRHEKSRILQRRPTEPQVEDDVSSALATDGVSDATAKAKVPPSSAVPNRAKWAQVYPSENLSRW